MSFAYWITVIALSTLPFAAAAQAVSPQFDPADPNAHVPAFTYRSTFKKDRVAADERMSPDKTWRAANDEMQGLGGHIGHLKEPSDVKTFPPASASAPYGMQATSEGK